jgi:hypothetical protein
MLQRTQLMLDEQTKNDLLYLSMATNRSMSSLVREFVIEKVKTEKKKVARGKRSPANGVEILLKMAASAERLVEKYPSKGPSDLSINHDHYLYGAPKKQA